MRDKLGIITGRFQGLHLGHMEYLLAGAERCGHLIVGVTNSAPWEEAPAELQGMARVKQSSNPFTFYERMVMLRDSLTEAGLPRESFDIVPFPIDHLRPVGGAQAPGPVGPGLPYRSHVGAG